MIYDFIHYGGSHHMKKRCAEVSVRKFTGMEAVKLGFFILESLELFVLLTKIIDEIFVAETEDASVISAVD